MDLLIFFSIVFATIVFSIILERIIHCPVLVGFALFSIFLIVAAVLNNTTYIIIALALGILAFIVAFLDCIFRNSNFFRNSRCLGNNNDDSDCNCGNNADDTLTILNSNGRVVARINGNNITCNDNNNNNCACGCGNNNLGISLVSNNENILNNSENNCSCCGCNSRSYGQRRY